MWIHNWPAFSTLFSSFQQITGISSEFVLLIYPTFFNLLLIIPLFVIFRFILTDFKLIWTAVWFVFFGNWIGQDYFSMQSLAFLMMVLSLFALLKFMNKNNSRQFLVMFLLFFFFIAASHVLTSIALLTVTILLYLTKRLERSALVLSLISLFGGWTIFGAITYLSHNLMNTLSGSMNILQNFQINLTGRISGSGSHMIITEVRIILTLTLLVFSILGIILTWKNKKFGVMEREMLIILEVSRCLFWVLYMEGSYL